MLTTFTLFTAAYTSTNPLADDDVEPEVHIIVDSSLDNAFAVAKALCEPNQRLLGVEEQGECVLNIENIDVEIIRQGEGT